MGTNKNINQSKVMVSVCLLSYNHGHLIGSVIESILKQSFTDYELIVSDNCSTDDSWSIISDYADKYSSIKAIKTPSNIGMGGNINFVASFAKGKYLAILHHDDILHKQLIEKWVYVAEKYTDIAFVFNEYLSKGIEGHKSEGRLFSERMDGYIFFKKCLLKGWGCPVRGTALLRKDCFKAIGGANPQFGIIADVDLWMKLSVRWAVGYVNEPLIEVFHQRPDNYPKEYTRFSWETYRILFNIHANNINKGSFGNIFVFTFYWFCFKFKVSFEIVKWLVYAVIRRKKEMILSSDKVNNAYEFYIVKLFRSFIVFCFGLIAKK